MNRNVCSNRAMDLIQNDGPVADLNLFTQKDERKSPRHLLQKHWNRARLMMVSVMKKAISSVHTELIVSPRYNLTRKTWYMTLAS